MVVVSGVGSSGSVGGSCVDLSHKSGRLKSSKADVVGVLIDGSPSTLLLRTSGSSGNGVLLGSLQGNLRGGVLSLWFGLAS